MKKTLKLSIIALTTLSLGASLTACSKKTTTPANKINVVSSVNFYGDISKNVLGKYGTDKSIINSNVDPHDFEPTTSNAKLVVDSNVVIENGVGYDGWIQQMIQNEGSGTHNIINVGKMMGKKDGDNEHIWYNPETADKLVDKLISTYSSLDPAHKTQFEQNGQAYKAKWAKTRQLVKELSKHSHGKQVAVSEPVFDYSLQAMGYKIVDNGFANAIDKGVDPSIGDIKMLQNDLKNHKVAFFVNNTQASSPVVSQMVQLAKKNSIPIVNVTETEPTGKTYIQWMNEQYNQVKKIQNAK